MLEQLRLCVEDLWIKSTRRVRWPISDARTDLRESKAHPSDSGWARESSNCSPAIKMHMGIVEQKPRIACWLLSHLRNLRGKQHAGPNHG